VLVQFVHDEADAGFLVVGGDDGELAGHDHGTRTQPTAA
jgi:hypothetical protein